MKQEVEYVVELGRHRKHVYLKNVGMVMCEKCRDGYV
jgi:hypothetical protein